MKAPLWIDLRDALALHDRMLVLDGGAAGVRSQPLLESALAHPRQLYAYGDSPDIVDLAAGYTFGIVRNHPFIDGNKRTGFVIGVLFLELNGYEFTASEEDATEAVLQLAAGKMSEPVFGKWMRANSVGQR
jgi:death-on-curing protein